MDEIPYLKEILQAAGAAAYVVLTALVALVVYWIQDRRKISAEREAREAKALADRQAREHQIELERKLHLARVSFEREFNIYQELWSKTIALRRVVFDLRPSVSLLTEESEKDRYDRKRKALNAAYAPFVIALDENKPFYSEGIYEIFERLRKAVAKESFAYQKQVEDGMRGQYHPDPFTEAEENQAAILALTEEACTAIKLRFGSAPGSSR